MPVLLPCGHKYCTIATQSSGSSQDCAKPRPLQWPICGAGHWVVPGSYLAAAGDVLEPLLQYEQRSRGTEIEDGGLRNNSFYSRVHTWAQEPNNGLDDMDTHHVTHYSADLLR